MILIRVQGNDAAGYKEFITLTAGDTIDIPIKFDVLDPDDDTYDPINLTGYTARMTIGLATPVELTTENGGIIIDDAANGEVRIYVEDSVTADWTTGVYAYDFWLINPAGEANGYLEGYIKVKEKIA